MYDDILFYTNCDECGASVEIHATERKPPRTRKERSAHGFSKNVELRGIEPLTYSMRTSRATNCAIAPDR